MNLLNVTNALVLDRDALEGTIDKLLLEIEEHIIKEHQLNAFHTLGKLQMCFEVSGRNKFDDPRYQTIARMFLHAYEVNLLPGNEEKEN